MGSSFGSIGYPGYSTVAMFAPRGFSECWGGSEERHCAPFCPCHRCTRLNSEAAYEMNAELGTHTDSPQEVAEQAVIARC